ncbi:cytidine deaminase [Rhodothalassium salexigens]|nr:cytidine deaminase [Rhodothalassium salexigens]MBK5911495.1 cytidine deaminase [Rhodothalassium salexigens]MBK5919678.1 cytidine deaminase [Rhodothalassium salexigens]
MTDTRHTPPTMAATPLSDDDRALVDAALAVRARAYAPYSHFHVGAAARDEHGRVHLGCNVENAAYGECVCAEANAIGALVAAGGRRLAAIAVAGGPADGDPVACPPCGGCRQRIAELGGPDTRVLMVRADGAVEVTDPDRLLPGAFRL